MFIFLRTKPNENHIVPICDPKCMDFLLDERDGGEYRRSLTDITSEPNRCDDGDGKPAAEAAAAARLFSLRIRIIVIKHIANAHTTRDIIPMAM